MLMLILLHNLHRLPFSPASEYWALQALWGKGRGVAEGKVHRFLVQDIKSWSTSTSKLIYTNGNYCYPGGCFRWLSEDGPQQTSSFRAVCKTGSSHSLFIKTTSTYVKVHVIKKSLSGLYNISTKIIKYTVKKFLCCFNNILTAFLWNVVKYGFGHYNWCFYKE